jgi:hypothetical protein
MLEFLLPPGFLDAEPPYWYAVVRAASLPARDYDGVPRGAAADAETRILVFEPGGEGIEGGVFVARYSESLGYITDSWYATREAAAEDIAEEFGDGLGPWTPVPPDEDDPERHVLTTVGRSVTA